MSCTIVALPLALSWVVAKTIAIQIGVGAVASCGIAAAAAGAATKETNTTEEETEDSSCNEAQILSEKHFIEKSFETPFMDKALLIKTLEEHGANGINETDFGQIKCFCDHYELIFERTNADKPYYVRIKALDTDDTESKLNDLNSEYAVNVQEASYNSIVSKLEENNLEIENEEVCDDNTIVLTVNLE